MPSYDERTPRGLLLPFKSNTLEFDVERLRESFSLIDEALSELETQTKETLTEAIAGIEEKQYILSDRMDVIAGQTTEDSEILDARVDAKGVTHPNVGHNVRELHTQILALAENTRQHISEFQELLQRVGELADIQEQDRQTAQDDRQAIRSEIAHEVQDRAENDYALQAQTDTLSGAIFHQALSIRQEAEKRRKVAETLANETAQLQSQVDTLEQKTSQNAAELHNVSETLSEAIYQEQSERARTDAILSADIYAERVERAKNDSALREELHSETVDRFSADESLQRQINANAEGILRTVLFAQEASENARGETQRLDEEVRLREEADRELQRAIDAEEAARELEDKALDDYISRVDEQQTESLNQEARTRERSDSALNTRLNQEAERITQVNTEAQSRAEELSENISAEREERTLRDKELNAEIDAEKNSRILSDSCEASERAENDAALQRQADNLAKTSLQHSLTLLEDTQKIRGISEAIDNEAAQRVEADNNLQEQVDTLSQKTSHNAAEIQNVSKALDNERVSRIEALTAETQDRADNDSVLQRQADNLSYTSMRQSLMLLEEAEYRRADIQKEATIREAQDNELRQALDSEISSRVEADDVLRMEAKNALDAETTERVSQGEVLQQQADSLSTASLRQNLMLLQEAEKRRELSQVVAGIKSPVDWSSADSIAIPEPRCAVVNFTGINAMPTSKTVDIPAVLEFWDLQGNYFKKPITCAAQGSSSMGFVKKNIKLDLLNDDGSEFNLKIGDWVVQDGYHLKAYYTDFFRGIGVTSYKVWEEIMQTKPHKAALVNVEGMNETATGAGNVSDLTLQIDTGALCHPDGFPCVVYLNGEFYGLFSWQIKKQRKNYHMDKSTVEHIHLDGTISTDTFWNGTINWTAFEIRNPNKLYTMDGKKYDGDAPRELIDETSDKYDPDNKDHVRSKQVKRYIQDFVRRFGELKTSPSRELYEQLFDWQNQRDYLIFSDVVSNRDGYAKNWQWTTYDGAKWYVNAYDLDMTFGGMFTGQYLTAPLTGHIVSGTALPTGFIPLLYKSELEARYKALRDAGIIDVEHIAAKLQDWTARIGEGNYELEYERWPNSPCLLNYNDSVDRVRKWLTVEIANMDKVYGYVPENDLITAEIISREKADRLEALKRENADSAEAMSRRNDDDALQRQIDRLADYAIRDTLKTAENNSLHKQQLQQEIDARAEQDNVLSEQITSLEKSSRDETSNFQEQINSVIMTMLRFAVNDYEARERLREYINDIYQAVADTGNLTYMGARVASTNEVGDMLADVMAGTDTGETSTSEIPEELRDKVSTSSEVSEMLAEIFPNNN